MTVVTHAGFGQSVADQPLLDQTAYGAGPDDSIVDVTEAAAITHHTATIGGVPIAYTATAGHLVAVDQAVGVVLHRIGRRRREAGHVRPDAARRERAKQQKHSG